MKGIASASSTSHRVMACEAAGRQEGDDRIVDVVVIAQFAAIAALMFLQVLLTGLYVKERSTVESLRGKIKREESELKQASMELVQWRRKEQLLRTSASIGAEQDIHYVKVVK